MIAESLQLVVDSAPFLLKGAGYTVLLRSEERRGGKGVDLGGRRIIKKKNHSNRTYST